MVLQCFYGVSTSVYYWSSTEVVLKYWNSSASKLHQSIQILFKLLHVMCIKWSCAQLSCRALHKSHSSKWQDSPRGLLSVRVKFYISFYRVYIGFKPYKPYKPYPYKPFYKSFCTPDSSHKSTLFTDDISSLTLSTAFLRSYKTWLSAEKVQQFHKNFEHTKLGVLFSHGMTISSFKPLRWRGCTKIMTSMSIG